MKKILALFFTALFLSQIIYAQQTDLSKLQLSITNNRGSNGWSPDGKLFVTYTRSEEKTKLWNLSSDKTVWEVSLDSKQESSEPLNYQTFIWSLSQKYLIVKDERENLFLLNSSNGNVIWKKRIIPKGLEIIKFSPDEKQIILIYSNENQLTDVQFLDITSGNLTKSFKTKVNFYDSFSFSKDGKVLMFGNFEGKAIFIDSADGKVIKSLSLKPCGNLLNTFSNKTAFSPNFDYLVARCRDKTVITNVSTGKVLKVFKMQTDFEKTIGFSGDGKILVLEDLGAKVFNFSNGKENFIDDINLWFHIDLNYDGTLLMNNTDYKYRGYEIAEIKTGKIIKNFEDHPGIIKSLAFNLDGSRFASGSTDCVLRIWDAQTKQILFAVSGHTTSIDSIKFNIDGKTITSKSENETIVWDSQNGKKISEEKIETQEDEKLKEKVTSPNGDYFLEDMGDEKPFELRNVKSGNLIQSFSGLTQIQGFKFTLDEERFLSAAYFQPLQLWDIKSGKKLLDYDIGYSYYNVIAFSPNRKIFITGGRNQNILMYELNSGKLLWSLFPIDQLEMQAEKAEEARRIKSLEDKAKSESIADAQLKEAETQVFIKFSHYGKMSDPGNKKMAESDVPKESIAKKPRKDSNAVWLRLYNNSLLPIQIPTQSFYFPNPKCFFTFPNGKKLNGLCDKREVFIWHRLQDKNSEWIPFGFDFGSSAILLPKTSVLFPVPLAILQNENSIVFSYKFQNENENKIEDYGTVKELKFSEKDLPQ